MSSLASASATRARGLALWGTVVIALSLTSVYVILTLANYDWNPSIFLAVGSDLPIRDYVVDLLGSDIDMRGALGHDGQYFFAQANDPLLLDPEVHAALLDRPAYRSQRVLFPLLAGGFGLFPPGMVVWTMLALSVLTFGFGTYVTALVAEGMGGSPLWGLAFCLNLGVISELLIGGTGHLGLALVLAAVAALQRGWVGGSIAALTAAALTREVLLVAAAGIAVWLWQRSRPKLAALHLVVPTLAAVVWAAYVRFMVSDLPVLEQVEGLGLPFVGLFEAFPLWWSAPMNLAIGIVIILVLVLFARRLLTTQWLVGFAAAGFVPLSAFLSREVWFHYFDITRAVSPVIIAFLLVAFAAKGRSRESDALVSVTT